MIYPPLPLWFPAQGVFLGGCQGPSHRRIPALWFPDRAPFSACCSWSITMASVPAVPSTPSPAPAWSPPSPRGGVSKLPKREQTSQSCWFFLATNSESRLLKSPPPGAGSHEGWGWHLWGLCWESSCPQVPDGDPETGVCSSYYLIPASLEKVPSKWDAAAQASLSFPSGKGSGLSTSIYEEVKEKRGQLNVLITCCVKNAEAKHIHIYRRNWLPGWVESDGFQQKRCCTTLFPTPTVRFPAPGGYFGQILWLLGSLSSISKHFTLGKLSSIPYLQF